jgi:hypothetical protein
MASTQARFGVYEGSNGVPRRRTLIYIGQSKGEPDTEGPHYMFGMARDFGGKPWSLVHHVCVKSAVERIAPERTYLYYEFEPTGNRNCVPAWPSLPASRRNAVGVLAIRPYSRTSPRRPLSATATTIPSL